MRLRSLDVFRGLTIAGMILVNNAGDWSKTYAPLLHAEWHGWTPTDLVFPFFLFIVGVAIPFALAGKALPAAAGVDAAILRRAVLLFAIGLVLIWFPFYTVSWERARIFGVLQRIGIVYAFSALAYVHWPRRRRIAFAVLLLGGYWLLMRLVPVPGFPLGDLSAKGNVAFWVDSLVLGSHIWRYSPGPGDPEGLLSTLPAIVTCFIGVWVGEFLRSVRTAGDKLRRLLAWGVVAAASGLLLHRFFPINKNLWSPSYVVFTAGAALLVFAVFYAWVDRKAFDTRTDTGAPALDTQPLPRVLRPLAIFGVNSILAYAGSSLLARTLGVIKIADPAAKTGSVTLQRWLYDRFYDPIFPDYVASLAWALTHVLLWLAILAWLDRRRIYLKV